MYPTQMRQGYNSIPPEGNPRRTEGWALTESARLMAAGQREPFDRKTMLEAVRRNWRLWTIFQAGALAPDSPLPEEVKVNVLSLANFIDKHTVSILADPKPEKLNILISINREIAAGLMTQVPGAGGTVPSAGPPPTGGTSIINQSA